MVRQINDDHSLGDMAHQSITEIALEEQSHRH